MKRRYFLRAAALGTLALPISANRFVPSILLPNRPDDADAKGFPLAEITIDALQQKMQSGAETAESNRQRQPGL